MATPQAHHHRRAWASASRSCAPSPWPPPPCAASAWTTCCSAALRQRSTCRASPPAAAASPAAEAAAPPLAEQRAPSRTRVQDLEQLGRHSHRVLLSYDGTRYRGWQLQLGGAAHVPTVQHAVEHALSVVLREPRTKLGVSAAGRTDAGVHAAGQVVQFFTDTEPDASKLHRRINGLLPPDVRAMAVRRTAPDFHVTISATGKTYRYWIDTGEVHDPLTHRFRMHHHHLEALDVGAMRRAAQLFVGTHDFTQFSNHSVDTARRNPVKHVWRVEVADVPGGLMVEVEGAGFLYRQVRHMVGALVAVGQGRITPEHVAKHLEMGASQLPGAGGAYRGWNCAPAKGLFLHQVHYPPQVDDPGALLFPDYPHDEWGRLVHRPPGAETDAD